MIELLQYDFMQRAFIAGIIAAVICASLGVFLVLKRLSLIGDGLAHVAFGGVALGFLLGINPIISALFLAVIGALVTYRLQVTTKLYGETTIALMIATGLGLGVVIISLARGLTTDLFSFLFGSILTVTRFDLALTIGLGFVVLASIVSFYKELVFLCFDEEGARASGIPVTALNVLLNVLTAIAIVISIRIVGILLISALIVVPVATALQIAKSFWQTLVYAVIFAVVAVIAGLTLSFYFNLAAGGIIVLISVFIFSIVLLLKKLTE